jgi:hypothetical protein
MNRLHLSTLLACTVALLGACSAFDPKNTNPYCGEAIDFQQVQLVDLTSFDMQEGEIRSALQAKFGSYNLVTEKPVQVPRDYAYWSSQNISGISGAKSEAAQWGCNLLVLVEVKAARTSVGKQARNEDRAWMVLVGTVGQ